MQNSAFVQNNSISSPWMEIKFLADCCWFERRRSKDNKYVRRGTEGMNENTNFSTTFKNLTKLHRCTISSEFCLHPRRNLAWSQIELPVNPILGLAALIYFQSSTKSGYFIKGRHYRHILSPFGNFLCAPFKGKSLITKLAMPEQCHWKNENHFQH
jgi:hypothetical protein